MLLSLQPGVQVTFLASVTPAAWNSIHLFRKGRQHPPLSLLRSDRSGMVGGTRMQLEASPNKDLGTGSVGEVEIPGAHLPSWLAVTPGRTSKYWQHPRAYVHQRAISLFLRRSVVWPWGKGWWMFLVTQYTHQVFPANNCVPKTCVPWISYVERRE